MNGEAIGRGATTPWPPTFFELSGEYISRERHTGQTSWYVRGQNVVIVVSWAAAGEVLREPAAPDEHAIVVPEGGALTVGHDGVEPVEALGPALVVAAPGGTEVTVGRPGFVIRVFTARSEVTAKAVNHAAYAVANARVAPLPDAPNPPRSTQPRVFSLDEGPTVPDRVGRLYRTDSLMIDWFPPQEGPRDVDDLCVRRHDDVEQASLTLAGDYVHHVRRPWTSRMRDWHADEHVQVSSPSVALIAPGNVHATRAVGSGRHQLIEVSAPVRPELVERGWVLNQADYDREEED